MRKLRNVLTLGLIFLMIFSFAACDTPPVETKFTVSIAGASEGLESFSVKSGDTNITDGAKLVKNTVLTVSWKAESGYRAELYINDAVVSTAQSPHSVTLTEDTKIEVKSIAQYSVNVVNNTTGLTSYSVKQGSSELTKGASTNVDKNTEITVTWAAAAAYEAVLYINDVPNYDAASPYVLNITANTKIEVSTSAIPVRLISIVNGQTTEHLTSLTITAGTDTLTSGENQVLSGKEINIAWVAAAGFKGVCIINGNVVSETSPFTHTVTGVASIEVKAVSQTANVIRIDNSDTINDSFTMTNGGASVPASQSWVIVNNGASLVITEGAGYYSYVLKDGATVAGVSGVYTLQFTTSAVVKIFTDLTEATKLTHAVVTVNPIEESIADNIGVFIVKAGITNVGSTGTILPYGKNKVEKNQRIYTTVRLTGDANDEGVRAVIYNGATELKRTEYTSYRYPGEGYEGELPSDANYTTASGVDLANMDIRVGLAFYGEYKVSFVNAAGDEWLLEEVSGTTFQYNGFTVSVNNTFVDLFEEESKIFDGTRIVIQFGSGYKGTVSIGGTDIPLNGSIYNIQYTDWEDKTDGNNLVITVDRQTKVPGNVTIVAQSASGIFQVGENGGLDYGGLSNGDRYYVGDTYSIRWALTENAAKPDFVVKLFVNEDEVYSSSKIYDSYELDTTGKTSLKLEVRYVAADNKYSVNFTDNAETPAPIVWSSLTGLTVTYGSSNTSVGANSTVRFDVNTTNAFKFTNAAGSGKTYIIQNDSDTRTVAPGANITINYSGKATVKVFEAEIYTVSFVNELGTALTKSDIEDFFYLDLTPYASITELPIQFVVTGASFSVKLTNKSYDVERKIKINGGEDITIGTAYPDNNKSITITDDTVITVYGLPLAKHTVTIADKNGNPIDNFTAPKVSISIDYAPATSNTLSVSDGKTMRITNEDDNNDIQIEYGGNTYTINKGWKSLSITITEDLTIKLLHYENGTGGGSVSSVYVELVNKNGTMLGNASELLNSIGIYYTGGMIDSAETEVPSGTELEICNMSMTNYNLYVNGVKKILNGYGTVFITINEYTQLYFVDADEDEGGSSATLCWVDVCGAGGAQLEAVELENILRVIELYYAPQNWISSASAQVPEGTALYITNESTENDYDLYVDGELLQKLNKGGGNTMITINADTMLWIVAV